MEESRSEEVLVAYDCSGSTNGSDLYHRTTQKIIQELVDKEQSFKIVLWDDRWRTATTEELQKINRMQNGFGGTTVSNVAKAVKLLDFTGKLILITDGQVGTYDIDECDWLLRGDRRFSHVDVYLIKSYNGFGGEPNMSVSCPFTRLCSHDVHYITYEHNDRTSITPDDLHILNTIDTIDTLQDFDDKKDSILRALTARMMGKADIDIEIHDQIVRLRKRIVYNIAMNKHDEKPRTWTLLYEKLKSTSDSQNVDDWDTCVELYRRFVGEYYNQNSNSFEKDIAELLNISKGGLRTCFSHRLRRASDVQDVLVKDIEQTQEEPDDTDYTCPITLDNEKDVVLLIKDNKPLIGHESMHEKIMEDIINCPLNVLNYPDLCKAILETLDCNISLSAYLQAEESGKPIRKSPFTRSPVSCVLYLGSNTSQVAGTNMAITKILTGQARKKIGNMNLWFAVLYLLMKDKERFADVLPFVEKQMKWRLANTMTFASMSGLTKYPNTRVPLALSCWMVVVSPLLKLKTNQDMVRAHVFHLKYLFELLALTGLYVPSDVLENLKHYAVLLRTMLVMLSMCKKQENKLDVMIRALYQKCIRVEYSQVCGIIKRDSYCCEFVEWVPIDGSASSTQIEQVLKDLNLELASDELIGLHAMVSPSLSAENIPLNIDWKPTSLPSYSVSWQKYGTEESTVSADIPICPSTCRPYYKTIDEETWEQTAERVYQMRHHDLISANANFIHFVERYDRYPKNHQEFLTYLYYYYVVNRKKNSLPAPIMQFIKEIIDSYSSIVRTIPVEEFKRRTADSLMIEKRLAMETGQQA